MSIQVEFSGIWDIDGYWDCDYTGTGYGYGAGYGSGSGSGYGYGYGSDGGQTIC